MHIETVDQVVSLPQGEMLVRHFEEEMRTTPKIHALIAIPYVRTELQLKLAWCMTGRLAMGEYDSDERKRSKEEKVLLMTHLGDLVICEKAAVSSVCETERYSLFFFRLMLEQMLVPALNICAKMLREGIELAKTLLLQALLYIHQSKPLRVNMKEPVELEHLRTIDEILRISSKELRRTK